MIARVYPDTCIIIYLVEQRGPLSNAIRSRLLPPNSIPHVVYTELTRLECRVWPMRQKQAQKLREFDDFFSTPGFRRFGMETAVFDLATELRACQGLKTADALHLAAAITAGCDEFWTNDNRLSKAAGKHLKVVVFDE